MESWGVYQSILNSACKLMGVPYVTLHRFDAETGMLKIVAMSGMNSQRFLQALAVIRKVLPKFDMVGSTFPADINTLNHDIYIGGKVVEAPIRELARGAVNPFVDRKSVV